MLIDTKFKRRGVSPPLINPIVRNSQNEMNPEKNFSSYLEKNGVVKFKLLDKTTKEVGSARLQDRCG